MTEASHEDVFVDRRTADQRAGELATPVLFWYDEEGKGRKRRRRTNGVAMTTDGVLMVARTICSRKDQFVKANGRLVVEKRILGRAKRHCWMLHLDSVGDCMEYCEAAATAYREMFPENEIGIKRAYNAGRVFANYQADIKKRADALDEL